ncbi:MAG: carboxylesterase family protein [Bacteroidales bacterium]
MSSSRRKFIQTMGTGAAGFTLGSASLTSCTSSGKKEEEDGQVIFIGDNIAIADSAYGKVRGFIHKDIYNFLGIPYGATTGGKNRFMPAQKPEPWTDIYPAVYWPNAAPQILDNFYANRYLAFTDYWHYDDVSENCLGINVWTPGYNDNTKRPVILWIHGGGYTSGNSIEHPEYHGENLSRRENVVFCSLNHRLGPLGFSDFSAIGGEKYAASGNVGMLDIVAALEWIRDNISNFGGDPGNLQGHGFADGVAQLIDMGLRDGHQVLPQGAFDGCPDPGGRTAQHEFFAAGVLPHESVVVEHVEQAAGRRFVQPQVPADFDGAQLLVVGHEGQQDLQGLLHRQIVVGRFVRVHLRFGFGN